MKLITPQMYIGTRVLFIWNSIPFTGTITGIGIESYCIKCDSDHYTTDILMIPRMDDEIFVNKNKCLKTGEITPIIYTNGDINNGYNFPDVKTAFYHLPKQTIYPFISGRLKKFIDLVPEKFVIKLSDGKYYLYTQLSTGLVTLIDIKDKTTCKTPMWKFQKGVVNEHSDDKNSVTEFDIDMIYEIPENHIYDDANILLNNGVMNIVYNIASHDNIKITHFVRTHSDVNFDNLPDEILYDFNIHTK